jgi:hypothetical protein
MKNTHLFTNVTAIIVLFVVLLIGGTTTRVDPARATPVQTVEQAEPVHKMSVELVEISTPVMVKSSMSANMKKVFMIGREVGNAETLQAILLQESGGGAADPVGTKGAPVGKRSYGVMQVQVVAARSILQRHPEMVKKYFPGRVYASLADEEIIALLLTNDEANIRIAATHFKLYMQLCGGDWDRAVAAWNAGIGGVENIPDPAEYDYVISVKSKLDNVVRSFNRKNNLTLT